MMTGVNTQLANRIETLYRALDQTNITEDAEVNAQDESHEPGTLAHKVRTFEGIASIVQEHSEVAHLETEAREIALAVAYAGRVDL